VANFFGLQGIFNAPHYTAIVLRVRAEVGLTMLEVEPEVASKIQARARERGVSVDVYLRELIDQTGTEPERSNGLSSKERIRLLRKWAAGHTVRTATLSENAISRAHIYEERG